MNQKSLRVLMIISKNDKYGAQRVFLDQISALQRRGHYVIVVGRGAEGFVADAVRVMNVEYCGIPMNGIRDILSLMRLVNKYTIDIIHTSLDRADYFGLLLSWLTRRPVVSTMMVPRYHHGFKFADGVVVLSHMQRRILEEKGIRSDKISVIRPGIEVDHFANPDASKCDMWKQRLATENYSIIFCHIASMISRKGHLVSLDLAAECKKRREEPLVIIIGDPVSGEYYESLVKKISDAGLKRNIYFTGWTSEIPEILSFCHFTLLPSENEALGVVLMEGMAAGTPIIAREGEGGAELIEEYRTGFLYKPSEGIPSLADKILALWHDRNQFKILSDRCRDIGKREFSMERCGEQLEIFYHSLGV